MGRRPKKIRQKIVKGTSRAIVISILVHVGLGLLAAGLVIFTIAPKPPVEFDPPPQVQVPKMPLKKLKVRTKKPSKPKSTAKLTAVIKKVDISQIAFPDLPTSGIGPGIGTGGGGSGGFVDLPDLDDTDGLLGKQQSIGSDLEGTYYDIKRHRDGRWNGEGDRGSPGTFRATVNKFLMSGWNTSAFDRFYKSPKKRYATCVMIPSISSSVAPYAFGEDRASGVFWAVHYKGQIVHPEDITFRFWGVGDEIIAVRVNRKNVLADVWHTDRDEYGNFWQGNHAERKTYRLGHNTTMEVGDWITLKAGEPQDIEILVADNGGLCALMLLVEVKGVDYPQNIQGGPILPVFKTAELSRDLIDAIYKDLSPNECSLTNGPVFNDFPAGQRFAGQAALEDIADHGLQDVEDSQEIRTWTLADGTQLEARYLSVVGGNIIMETRKGSQKKIKMSRFTPDDIEFFELENPPDFRLNFKNKSSLLNYSDRFVLDNMPVVLQYEFGVSAEQRSAGAYNHEVSLEFFAIASQRGFNHKFVLVDRQTTSFTPSKENNFSHEFWSSRIAELDEYGLQDRKRRGLKYKGYVLIVTDKRGKVIGHKTSNKWLFENIEELRKRSVGSYIDESCRRVFPGRPKPEFY